MKYFNSKTSYKKTFYVIDGLISFEAPVKIDSDFSIQNRYVTLPYREAHNNK